MFEAPAERDTSAPSIRLVIADPQPIYLQGLKAVFAAQRGFEVVASCGNGADCLEAIRRLSPHVALVSSTLPDLAVSEILAIAEAEKFSTRLVVFSESDSEDLNAAIASGACGSISRNADPEALLRSILHTARQDLEAEHSFHPTTKGREEADAARTERMLELLTQRERQIVRLVSEGKSNKEIARALNVSQGTVKVHLYNVFQKLEINNRTVLASLALSQRQGLGALVLAALAFAIADDLKAAEANVATADGDKLDSRDPAQSAFEPWKKALLWQAFHHAGATHVQGGSAVESAPGVASKGNEGPHAPGQSAASSLDGGQTRPFDAPVLRTPPSLQPGETGGFTGHQPALPELAGSTKGNVGFGAFTVAVGAWIHALEDAVHAEGRIASDSTGHHGVLAGTDLREAVLGGAANDTIEGRGGSDAIPGRSGDGNSAPVAACREDGSTIGKAPDISVDQTAANYSPAQRDRITGSGPGLDRLMAAFGGLAFLHLTSTSRSVPPHTLAWIYDPASNVTIVYVNLTDRSLRVGDAGLLEIRLQGEVSVAGADVTHHAEGAFIKTGLDDIDAALRTAAAGDGMPPAIDGGSAGIAAEDENGLAAGGVRTLPFEYRVRLANDQGKSSAPAALVGSGDRPSGPQAENAGAVLASASPTISASIKSVTVLSEIATVEAPTNPLLSRGPAQANMEPSTAHDEPKATPQFDPFNFGTRDPAIAAPADVAPHTPASIASGNSASHGHPQNASGPASTAAVTEPAEPDTKPGNGFGREQNSTASAAQTTTADASETAAPGNSAGHRNPQNASGPASRAAVTEPAEPDTKPGNGFGREQNSSASAAQPTTVDAFETAAPGNSAGHGHPQNAAEAASTAAVTELAEPDTKPGNGFGREQNSSASAAQPTTVDAFETAAPGNSAGHGHPQNEAAVAAVAEPAEPDTKPGNGFGREQSSNASAAQTTTADASEPAAPGNSAGRGHPQNATEAASTAAVTEPAEPDTRPGNGFGREQSSDASAAQTTTADASEPAAPGNSAGRGHPQNATEAASTAAVTEPAEPDTKPGNGFGREQNSSASAAQTTTADASEPAAPGNSAGHGHPQNASEAASTAAVTEPAEPDTRPGNGFGREQSSNASAAQTTTADASEPDAPGNSAGHGHPQDASEATSTAAVTEPAEPDTKPGNGFGREQNSNASTAQTTTADASEPAAPGHGNSQNASEATSTAAVTEPAEPDTKPGNGFGREQNSNASMAQTTIAETPAPAAPGNSGGHGHPQDASEATSTAAVTEPAEPDTKPGNGFGREQNSNTSTAQTTTAETSAPAAPGNSAGHGNSQNASEATSTAAVTEPAEPDTKPGNGFGREQNSNASASQTTIAETPAPAAPSNSGGHGHPQDASEATSTAAATEPAEPDTKPGNGFVREQSSDASAAQTTIAETSEPSAPGNSAGHGSSQNASEATSTAAVTEPAEPDTKPGNGFGREQNSNTSAAQTTIADASETASPGNSAGRGHPQNASEATSTAAVTEAALAASDPAQVAGPEQNSSAATGNAPVSEAGGAVDVDLDYHPSASILSASQAVTWHGAGKDFTAELTTTQIMQLKSAFTVAAPVSDSIGHAIGWTWAVADDALDFLGAGESLTIASPVAIDDGRGGTFSTVVNVKVEGANDAPVATADANATAKGSTLTVTAAKGLLSNDTDPDLHDQGHLFISAVGGGAANVGQKIVGAYGTATISSDGSYTYVANKGGLPPKTAAQDVFTYAVADGHGGVSTATLSITVLNPGANYVAGQSAATSVLTAASAGEDHERLFGGTIQLGGAEGRMAASDGADTFLFRPNFGASVISDFDVDHDSIQFDRSIFADAASVLAHTADAEGNAVISGFTRMKR